MMTFLQKMNKMIDRTEMIDDNLKNKIKKNVVRAFKGLTEC